MLHEVRWSSLQLEPAAVAAGPASLQPTHTHAPRCSLRPGIGIRESFNSNSTSALLATGILDSLAAGVLLYVVLVQLVAPMLTDSAWLHAQRWYMQVGGAAWGVGACWKPARVR